jgi:hypothetical protein
LNDCSCETLEDSQTILDKIDGDVDVLLTQFSYAVRTGNQEDIALRAAASVKKLAAIKLQTAVFQPKTIIPFASYIYFCHTDNHYMNDAINKIGDVHSYIEKETGASCHVMYPGDKWSLSHPYESKAAIAKYNIDYQKIAQAKNSNLILSKKVPLEELQDMANHYAEKIKKLHGSSLFFQFFIPTKIYLEDYQQSFSFDLKRGIFSKYFPKERCDISLKSDALMYCFTHLWGGDSLQINGRFQAPKKGNYAALRQYFKLSSWANQGIQYTNAQFLTSIVKVLLNKFIQI